MKWKSNSIADIDSFCNYVAEECRKLGRDNWAEDIQQFTLHAFLRQSEYVAELRSLQCVLTKMLTNQELLSTSLVHDIEDAGQVLNKIIQDNIV